MFGESDMAEDSNVLKHEALFKIDNFLKTGRMTLTESMVAKIMNLLYAEKGSCRDMMDYGVDIASFQFENLTDDLIMEIQGTINQQVSRYLPDISKVSIVVVPQEDGTQHYIDIVFNLTRPLEGSTKILVTMKKLNGKLNLEAFTNSRAST